MATETKKQKEVRDVATLVLAALFEAAAIAGHEVPERNRDLTKQALDRARAFLLETEEQGLQLPSEE